MAIAIKQIMLITRNAQFAIDVKRALEALGEFSVTTVADLRHAMQALQDGAMQLVLLDTDDLPLAPEIVIDMIRSRHARLAIVLAPDNQAVRELARRTQLRYLVDIPVMARKLLPILEAALGDAYGALPPASDAGPADLNEDTVTIESLVDDAFHDEPGLNYTRRRLRASLELLNPKPDRLPGDGLELLVEPDDESDTVRFRYVKGGDAGAGDSTLASVSAASLDEGLSAGRADDATLSELAQSLAASGGEETLPRPAPSSQRADSAKLDDSAAFQRLLDTLLDESTALENLTLESLFDTTRELPGALGTGAVPAWLRETEKFIREPSFLPKPDALPGMNAAESLAETTAPADQAAQTDNPPPVADAPPAKPAFLPPGDAMPHEAATVPAWTPLSSRESDPALAQLALTMTNAMSDLTAEATLLSRDNRVVAFSGQMTPQRFRELRHAIADDWAAEADQSRIRFIKLPSGEAEYMLCTRESLGGHCLTLIFAGDKSLRDIRLQGERMLRAIEAAQESDKGAETVDIAQAPPAAESMQPFAFVWLVADPTLALRKSLAEQLVFWLEVQLNSLNWTVHRLDAHQDFIYLFADVPSRASPDVLARAVMERARKIACSEDRGLPEDLWADAYLVLQPGRDMDERELRNFLRFARA